jgi:hypothetical protein
VVESQPCVSFSGYSGYGPHFKGIGQRFGDINLAFLDTGRYKHR